MTGQDPEVVERLRAEFPDIEATVSSDQPTVVVPREQVLLFAKHLKTVEGYAMFNDVLVVDWFPARPRFEVVYQVIHPQTLQRFRFKSFVPEGEAMPSITGVWAGANWPEREAFDLFGVVFEGHPNLARIYLPDDWEGYPLRKDYPTGGNRID